MPPPTARPPARRGSSGKIGALVVILLMVAAGVTVAAVGRGDGADDRSSAERPGTDSPGQTTTTLGRLSDSTALDAYCLSPGAAWDEVPAHVPGEPSRAWVHFDQGAAVAGGYDNATGDVAFADGGSTVISPHTDGRYIHDVSVLPRTRAVACVAYADTVGTGNQCAYGRFSIGNPDFTMETGRSRFVVTVYELHSGGVLHRGEIFSNSSGCPDKARQDSGPYLTRAVTDAEVLAWVSSHFVDGAPH